MPSERNADVRSGRDRDRDHRDRGADRDRHRASRHGRERSRERERGAGHARDDRPRDKERRHRSRSREREAGVDRHRARERGREVDMRDDRKRSRSHERASRREQDEPPPKASRHRSPEERRDSRRADSHSRREEIRDGQADYEHDMNGGSAMDEDGALPAPLPPQPQELNFDADITPEEMQMMATMGIPFGFDTTQGKEQKDDRTKAGAVKVKKNRLARQYMNRRGGFNRPLPAERTGEKTQVTSTR